MKGRQCKGIVTLRSFLLAIVPVANQKVLTVMVVCVRILALVSRHAKLYIFYVISPHVACLSICTIFFHTIFLKYNQQEATLSRSIYFYKLLYIFQAVSPPIIRSTRLYIQRDVLSNQYFCLLLSWMNYFYGRFKDMSLDFLPSNFNPHLIFTLSVLAKFNQISSILP
jgi:hypothetical protein